jgi:hypothetical protein
MIKYREVSDAGVSHCFVELASLDIRCIADPTIVASRLLGGGELQIIGQANQSD